MTTQTDILHKLAKLIKYDEAVLRAVNLPDATIKSSFQKASKAKRYERFMAWPALILAAIVTYAPIPGEQKSEYDLHRVVALWASIGLFAVGMAKGPHKLGQVAVEVNKARDTRLLHLDSRMREIKKITQESIKFCPIGPLQNHPE